MRHNYLLLINFCKFIMFKFRRLLLPAILLAAGIAVLAPAGPAQAGFDLYRLSGGSTVYYLDANGVRHAFPDSNAYASWYGVSGAKPITISRDFLAKYPLGKNITLRPGSQLVKVPTAPEVYAVEQGGLLRPIADESVAKEIYGADWSRRVVDIPEVFFDDYTVGAPLENSDYLPNDILVYDPLGKKYYYKFIDVYQPFASAADVSANYFRLGDAISAPASFYKRQRPITGLAAKIFNPAAGPAADNSDCENKNLKAAVIFLSDKSYTADQVAAVTKIKDSIAGRYAEVTYEMSAIDMSYPLVLMSDDGYFLRTRNDGAKDVQNELINSFYDKNEDVFDLIFVFTNFQTPVEADTNEIASYFPVSNYWEGIGRNNIVAAELFGSAGKLKGVIMMGNIAKYSLADGAGFNGTLNYAMHEMLHQWAAYVYFSDGDIISDKLLRPGDRMHWSYYAGFISPLGGSGWIDNGDGTFTSGLARLAANDFRRYSKLDLYLMGLIPYQLMEPIMYVEPAEPDATGNTIKGTARYVSIEQIIRANGAVRCGVKKQ